MSSKLEKTNIENLCPIHVKTALLEPNQDKKKLIVNTCELLRRSIQDLRDNVDASIRIKMNKILEQHCNS